MYNKNNISYEEKEKIKQIFIESHNFLYPYFSFEPLDIKSTNKINDYYLINDPSKHSKIIQRNKTIKKNKTLYEYLYFIKLNLYESYRRNYIIPNNLSYMFYGCSSLISISGISKWKTINVKDMSHMFENCTSLKI